MKNTYTASVVGGGVGGRLSLNALSASDRFDLVAACDLRADVRARLEGDYPGINVYPDHQTMFRECPTDVVCVSTYPPSHEEVALAALELDLKGILVEKPLGHTVASGRRIVEAVKARGLPLAVPHNLLVQAAAREVLARVRGGEIGELKLVEIENTGWDIISAGIHWLDYFVMLTGNAPLSWVMAALDTTTKTYRDGMQVETLGVTYAQTKRGVRVVMNTGDYVNVNRDARTTLFRIVGTKGLVELYGWDGDYDLVNADHPQGANFRPEESKGTGHQRHLERMLDGLESGEVGYEIADGSLAALELCEGAFLSQRHRCKVTFPLAEFRPPEPNDWQPGEPYGGEGGGRDGRKLDNDLEEDK